MSPLPFPPAPLQSDFPSLFVSLIEDPPWTRHNDKGEMEKYSEGNWKVVPPEDRLQLTKLEAQVSSLFMRLFTNGRHYGTSTLGILRFSYSVYLAPRMDYVRKLFVKLT